MLQTFKAPIDRENLYEEKESYKKAHVEWEVGFLCIIKKSNFLKISVQLNA